MSRTGHFRSELLLDTITVRGEQQRSGWYWYAYCKRKGKFRKAYLGKTEELSLEWLNSDITLNRTWIHHQT